MKKSLAILMMGILLLGYSGTALAVPSEQTDTRMGQKQAADRIKVKDLQRFDQLRQLREEGKATRQQIKADRVEVQKLIQSARDTHLPIIQQYRAELQGLRADSKTLAATQKSNWEAMRTALQAQDQGAMASTMNRIVKTRQEINQQLANIETTLAQFIQALQGK